MAFKNSMGVRKQMKFLNMFELRDQLLMLHLNNVAHIILETSKDLTTPPSFKSNAESKKEVLLSVSSLSYDMVAGK
jgi:hypothetical protein